MLDSLPEDQMRKLRADYQGTLAGKAAELEQLLDRFESEAIEQHRASLRAPLHRLAGSAPLYGFSELGSQARTLMHALDAMIVPARTQALMELRRQLVPLTDSLKKAARDP
jgi:HPt (histidine-containing phosphotransfer) domain-containing protein